MKKTVIKLTALAMVVIMMAAVLASCGGPSGEYEASLLGQSVSYTFKGSKVTIKATILGTVTTFEGKYKIADDEITITMNDKDGSDSYGGTYTFEKGDDYVKIGGIQYTKKK